MNKQGEKGRLEGGKKKEEIRGKKGKQRGREREERGGKGREEVGRKNGERREKRKEKHCHLLEGSFSSACSIDLTNQKRCRFFPLPGERHNSDSWVGTLR